MYSYRTIYKFLLNSSFISVQPNKTPVKKKSGGFRRRGKNIYFFRKDLQSVHWSMVGFCS